MAGAGVLQPVFAQEQSPLVDETRALLNSINEARAEIDHLRAQGEQAEGEERLLLERRRTDKSLEALGEIDTFVENVLEMERQGLNAAEFREVSEELTLMIAQVARQTIGERQAEISELGAQREEASGEDLVSLEKQLAEANETLDTLLGTALDNTEHMEALGLGASEGKAHLTQVLSERAANFSTRIELSLEQIGELQGRLAEKPDDADLETELAAVETKRDRSTATLRSTIALMDRLELPSAEYEELLIRATGQITTDILDKDVAFSLFGRWMEGIKTWLVNSGPAIFFKILVFALILFVFHLLSKFTRRLVARAVSASKLNFSELLKKMFVSIAGNAVWVAGILVALSQMGFALGPILAGLGIVGFVIGFALQETLGNFAAGMMILVYRPFDVGDLIEAAGVFGKVSAMSMVSTTVLTLDNQTLVVPNGKIWGDVIKNVTHQKVRRVDMVFGISYTDDIPHTEKVLEAILQENPKVIDDPAPIVKLHTLGESSVDFVVRPWCKTDDYWEVYWEVTREVKMRFDREGISIPFPQRDVHLFEEKRLAAAGGRDTAAG
jgi:small conductance mechanosensitive channel